MRAEAGAFPLELPAQRLEVVDLAVEDDHVARLRVGHWLTARVAQVDDRQTAVRKHDPVAAFGRARGPEAVRVGAAVELGSAHAPDGLGDAWIDPTEGPRDSTHSAAFPLVTPHASVASVTRPTVFTCVEPGKRAGGACGQRNICPTSACARPACFSRRAAGPCTSEAGVRLFLGASDEAARCRHGGRVSLHRSSSRQFSIADASKYERKFDVLKLTEGLVS